MTITICYAVIYFLEACILLQYCRNLFTWKRSAAFRITALTVGYFILFAGSFQENFTLNLILFLSVHVIFLYLAYDLKPLTALFHSLFITITMVLSELVIISLLSYFAPDFYRKFIHADAADSCDPVCDQQIDLFLHSAVYFVLYPEEVFAKAGL